MIVVAEDKDVWEKFPIPLINRLEKHYLGMETLLLPAQVKMVDELKNWINRFTRVQFKNYQKTEQFTPQDVFIGYHSDALASLVLKASKGDLDPIEEVKATLLRVAAPDAIARLSETRMDVKEAEDLCKLYYASHFATLSNAIISALQHKDDCAMLFVTTQSRLLTKDGKDDLERSMKLPVKILPLQQMNTEQQFRKEVSAFLDTPGKKVLLVQAQLLSQKESGLVECAKYIIQNELQQWKSQNQHCCIALVLQVTECIG